MLSAALDRHSGFLTDAGDVEATARILIKSTSARARARRRSLIAWHVLCAPARTVGFQVRAGNAGVGELAAAHAPNQFALVHAHKSRLLAC